MNDRGRSQLNQLVEAVLASRKYKNISRDYIETLGAQELAKRSTLKEAIKATKNKLHQVGGSYMESGEARYTSWIAQLRQAGAHGDKKLLEQACMNIMSYHASTRERLPNLEQFYTTLLADLPPIRSVIDIACGLHPLAIPWMLLGQDVQYYAYDIYRDMADFLNEFMELIQVQGYAQACDVIQHCPAFKVDLAFMLKAIPCFEQVDKNAGLRLLDVINADHLLVSFPVHSLGGRKKGMVTNYEARFHELVRHKNWFIERFEFPTELVFRIDK
jgi:16S rRNA (guanine(1405)-N(7))-methyltransferase